MVKEQITAKTETGWTKEFPTADGIYWYRWQDQTALYSITCGKVWAFNWTEEQHPPITGGAEWLGPISPSDTEQLIRLREAAEKARTWICRVTNEYSFGADDPHEVLIALRAALQVKAEMKGEQL